MLNDIQNTKNEKVEGDQPSTKQDVEKFRRQAQRKTEACRLSEHSSINSEQESSYEVIQGFEKAIKRRVADLRQQNADRLHAEQLALTDQASAENPRWYEPSTSNFRGSNLTREQEAWMRSPSKKSSDIIVNMYQEQHSFNITVQQEIDAWQKWLADSRARGPKIDDLRERNFQTGQEAYNFASQYPAYFAECNQERHQHQELLQQQAAYQEQLRQANQQSHYLTSSTEASTSQGFSPAFSTQLDMHSPSSRATSDMSVTNFVPSFHDQANDTDPVLENFKHNVPRSVLDNLRHTLTHRASLNPAEERGKRLIAARNQCNRMLVELYPCKSTRQRNTLLRYTSSLSSLECTYAVHAFLQKDQADFEILVGMDNESITAARTAINNWFQLHPR